MDRFPADEHSQKKLADQLKPGRTALVVVDVQVDFCDRQGAFGRRNFDLSGIDPAVDNLLSFMSECRQANVPIVFIRTVHSGWTDSESWVGRLRGAGGEMGICRANTKGVEFYRVEPRPDDFIATKHRFSGFVGTGLDLVLRSRGIETLLMTGVTTNVCVETTARDGFNRDYRIILVEDCCAAFSPEEHASTLTNISKYFGVVTHSKVLAETLREFRTTGAKPGSGRQAR